jgi:hypothetical protein
MFYFIVVMINVNAITDMKQKAKRSGLDLIKKQDSASRESSVMTRLAGKKHPVPALPLFAFASPLSKICEISNASAALLRLSAHAMRCEVRQKAAALFFEKSKNKSKLRPIVRRHIVYIF